MNKATKSLSTAMYQAFLNAFGSKVGYANVFRVDLSSGDQFFFSTTTAANCVGHADAIERLPSTKQRIYSLARIATVKVPK